MNIRMRISNIELKVATGKLPFRRYGDKEKRSAVETADL
jgi:hypothetical protein